MRFGIAGCGLIGRKRAAAAAGIGGFVTHVHDPDPQAAAAVAAATGSAACVTAADLLAAPVDAIIVATPHRDLAPLARAAVEAGKHVLVEKPAGVNAGEIARLADVARHRGRVVKVGYNHRFHPAFQAAHELLRAGRVGEIMFIRGRYGHGGRLGMEREWRCQRSIAGGGELIDQGSHLVDLARWLLGDLILDYAALPTCFWPIEVEDNCFLALRSATGAVAWLHASWTEWKNLFCFEIMGRHGKLTVDGLGGSYGVERLTLHAMSPAMGPPDTSVWEYPHPDTSWELELRDFARAVETGCRPCGDISDALANATLIDAIYQRVTP
jgi:predicted dehydrogenase